MAHSNDDHVQKSDPHADRLNSWKEIASYLNVSVRTVMRWEKSEGLPVRRHLHDKLSSLYAHKSELDGWWRNRSDRQDGQLPAPGPRGEQAKPSVAVLPFLSLSTSEEDEILSDGLSEELISTLSQIDGLRVVARTSCFYFKGKSPDVKDVGSRLGVRTILEGSVRRCGDRLRISAQLINTENGYHIWSQQYDRKTRDLLDVQEEIARSIARALEVELVGQVNERISKRFCCEIEAYEMYLKGLFKMHRIELSAAVECFEQALAREPELAPALAGLADAYATAGCMGFLTPSAAFAKAKESAVRALEIDDELADAHVELGVLWALEYQWQMAKAELRRALQLNPDHALAHLYYAGGVLAPQGRLDEAAAEQIRAHESDPVSPTVMIGFAADFLFRREYERSIEASRRVLELEPRFPLAYQWMGHALLLQGKYADAESALGHIETPVLASGFLGYCYSRMGQKDKAQALLRQLELLPGNFPPPAYQMAIVHLGMGKEDSAFEWLNRARDAYSWGIHFLKIDPIWDSLRSDLKFENLLKKMNLS